jgi:histidinol-phosphate/aromatic aminotransferase/cobyric acid decarboxylase-like protein
MQEILSQLSILVVLTGVSVAVIQYLFTNHHAHLKDFIASLVKIDFDKNNQYDLEDYFKTLDDVPLEKLKERFYNENKSQYN